MKNLYVYLFFLVGTASFAQLTVKPTSLTTDNYLYVKGDILYVAQDINLTENNDTDVANIYLREEAQIIQSNTTTSINKGTGNISLFQEGTTDAYAYNYWSSPVTVPGATDGNLTFSITSLNVPTTTSSSNPVNIVSGYNSTTTGSGVLNLAHYWIYKFVSPDGVQSSNWVQVKSQQTLNAGEGFTMKGVNGTDNTVVDGVANNAGSSQRYDFRGRPNDGLITIPIIGYQESYLLGNPYPSALDLNYFLLQNSAELDETTGDVIPSNVDVSCTSSTVARRNATTGIAYFWSSDPSVQSHNTADYVGGYASYSPNGSCSSTGIYTPPTYYNYLVNGDPVDGSGNTQPAGDDQYRRYLPIAQGFFVKAPESGVLQDVQFTNAHRDFVKEGTANESVFGRNSNNSSDKPKFDITEEQVIPKIRFNIAFDDDYTRQIALAFDDNATPNVDTARDAMNLYTISSDGGFLLENNNYTIDVRPFEENDRIPLYLNLSKQRDIAINVYDIENFDTNNIYLYDKDTETYHPIKQNTFYINLPAGNYSERFQITFKDEDESLSVAEEIAESFTVYQNNNISQLEIYNPMGADLKSVSIFDITGKQVVNQLNIGTENKYTFSTANLSTAVYVVRIQTSNNITSTKKISVLNRG
ncbi:Por secretion system C-terminal sorting domain-containing protein [Mesonia phycicola]|uniref:Por secretion system C-terminal sorting domain-containing protein n=1 Tax=Mesonia phycicola TaxID=579105 RepID=A0A1M6E101_9FLAO|nr:T9SS type A sorting domain-containing protein [Mesonia phycicola]SHI79204.1 Por secretion system C-terminal sorting domain-containing protein [Mesonia phycicola]